MKQFMMLGKKEQLFAMRLCDHLDKRSFLKGFLKDHILQYCQMHGLGVLCVILIG